MNKEILIKILKSEPMTFSLREIQEIMDEELGKDPAEMDTELIDLCMDILERGYETENPESTKKYAPKKLFKILIAAALGFVLIIAAITGSAELTIIRDMNHSEPETLDILHGAGLPIGDRDLSAALTEGAPVYGSKIYLSPDNPDNFSPLVYEGGDFTFYYEISAGTAPAEYGIGFMLNGIYQDIKIEYDGITTDYATMHNVQIPEHSAKVFKVMMKPNIGKKGDVLLFTGASIQGPSELITGDKETYSNSSHTLSAFLSSDFTMNCDSENTAEVCQDYAGIELTLYNKKIFNRFTTINEKGELCQSIIYHDLDKQLYYTPIFRNLSENTKIEAESTESFPLTIAMGGGKYGTAQRICVFVNGEIMPVFDGKYYADVPIERSKQTNVNITLDTSGLDTWNNIYMLAYTLDGSTKYEALSFTQSDVYVLKVNK